MDISAQKEAFSRALVSAVAAQAGYGIYLGPTPDDDSVDLCIASKNKAGRVRSPRLDVQLKCTSEYISTGTDFLSFRLKLKNYNDLRLKDCQVPRILVVVYAPENISEWLQFNAPENIILRRSAFWVTLEGFPESENETTVSIKISRRNVFDASALSEIMNRISAGGRP